MNGAYGQSRRRPTPEQKRSFLLSDQENDDLIRLLGRKCVTLATGVVQVLEAKHSIWQKICTGVCCYVKDSNQRSYYLRVYNIRGQCLVWEQELYSEFSYRTPRPYLLTFDSDDYRAALNFADADEARMFVKLLEDRYRKKLEKKARVNSQRGSAGRGGPASQYPSYSNNSSHIHQPPPQQHQQQYNFQQTTANVELKATKIEEKKSKKKKKNKLTKSDISLPSDFKHVGHVGWDPNKGFDINNVDPDTRQLLEEAGVTEKDMQDEKKRRFIYDFIEKKGGMEAVRKDTVRRSRNPPPPPPQSRSYHQPPQPPSRGSGPPPPPPTRSFSNQLPPQQRQHQRDYAPPAPPPRQPSQTNYAPSYQTQPPPPPPLVPSAPPVSSMVPPPPPLSSVVPSAPPAPAMGSGLLTQIQQKTELKPAADRPAQTGGRDALLEAIRRGKDLKAVSHEPPAEQAPPAGGEEESLASALARALQSRESAIHTDSDDEDSDDDDDDDWSE